MRAVFGTGDLAVGQRTVFHALHVALTALQAGRLAGGQFAAGLALVDAGGLAA
jgi:hypothetical protein